MEIMKLKIQYQSSKDIFILFCALNAMGYDDENNTRGMHPVRKKIRSILLKYDWDKKYPHLKKVFKKNHPWHLLNAILANSKNVKKTSSLDDFIINLKNFSKEPLLWELWKAFRIYQIKETKKLFSLFKEQTIGLIKFVNKPILNIKKIIFIVNPLDAYWRGYGFKITETGYIIVGPGADKNQGELLRHELLHILAPNFRLTTQILSPAKSLVNIGYNNKKTIRREYIIRALNLLYEEKILKNKLSKIARREQKDFPKIKEVLRLLEEKLKKGGQ